MVPEIINYYFNVHTFSSVFLSLFLLILAHSNKGPKRSEDTLFPGKILTLSTNFLSNEMNE